MKKKMVVGIVLGTTGDLVPMYNAIKMMQSDGYATAMIVLDD